MHEGDTLYSELHVDGAVPLPEGRGGVLKLRSLVYAAGDGAETGTCWTGGSPRCGSDREKTQTSALFGKFVRVRVCSRGDSDYVHPIDVRVRPA